MDARIQDLPFDPAALQRLPPGLIDSDHRNNYAGAAKRLNAIRSPLGWVLLAFQPCEGTLVDHWAAVHTHALTGGVPILALDPRGATCSWHSPIG
jgi:hypothetical protein